MSAVYVFGEPGRLLVKVGRAQHPAQRERALSREFGGQVLYLMDGLGYDYGAIEMRAHKLLRARYWLQGEWFVCGADVARRAVKQAERLLRQRQARWRREHRAELCSPERQARCRRRAARGAA